MCLKNTKLPILRMLCFLTIFYGGMIVKCQAMEYLSMAYNVGGYVVGAALSYLEKPKDLQEEFKEKITQLDIRGAEGIFQQKISELEASIDNDDFIFGKNKEQAITLYNRMVIAAVTVDYVGLCLDSINNVIKMLDQKTNQPQYLPLKGELEELKNLTESKLKVNLGSILYVRYSYERKGGVMDRSTASISSKSQRLQRWGGNTLPPPDYNSYVDKVKFEGKEDRIEIKNFLTMYNQYEITLELLSKTESALLNLQKNGVNSEKNREIDYYADPRVLSTVFGRSLELTPVKLHSKIFEINYTPKDNVEDSKGTEEKEEEEGMKINSKSLNLNQGPPKEDQNGSALTVEVVHIRDNESDLLKENEPSED